MSKVLQTCPVGLFYPTSPSPLFFSFSSWRWNPRMRIHCQVNDVINFFWRFRVCSRIRGLIWQRQMYWAFLAPFQTELLRHLSEVVNKPQALSSCLLWPHAASISTERSSSSSPHAILGSGHRFGFFKKKLFFEWGNFKFNLMIYFGLDKWHVGFLTRNWTRARYSGSIEPPPLHWQGSPQTWMLQKLASVCSRYASSLSLFY